MIARVGDIIEIDKFRKTNHDIDQLFINRWSPRSMSGEKISKEELMTLFEAARWAPSSNNNQSWRFIYAFRETKHWEKLFDLMLEGNQIWAKNAGVLIVIFSKDTFDYNNKPAITHSFDAGAAWENLALQGSLRGLVIHGMQGFDYDKAKEVLEIPDGYTIEAMVAIGKPGKKEDLPEKLQEREFPSDRKKIEEFAFEGKFVGG